MALPSAVPDKPSALKLLVLFFLRCFLRLACGEGGGSILGLVVLEMLGLEQTESPRPVSERRSISAHPPLTDPFLPSHRRQGHLRGPVMASEAKRCGLVACGRARLSTGSLSQPLTAVTSGGINQHSASINISARRPHRRGWQRVCGEQAYACGEPAGASPGRQTAPRTAITYFTIV